MIFNFEGNITIVQCTINDKMNYIIDKFLSKASIKGYNNNIFYLYNGTSINKELTFNEQSNDVDKNRLKMNIIVTKNDANDDDQSKRIILCQKI